MSAEDDQLQEQEDLALAAEAGIHRLAIPTPFMVGRVNAYLIEDDPLTLIDSGPNSAKALLKAADFAVDSSQLHLAIRNNGRLGAQLQARSLTVPGAPFSFTVAATGELSNVDAH